MRVRILSPVSDDDGHAALVIEMQDDRVLLRVARGTDPHGRAFIPGAQVQLLLGGRDAAHLFHATVASRPEDGVIAVLLGGHPMRLQRREYFRLAVRLPIVVRLPRENPDGDSEAGGTEPPPAAPEIRIFRLADLSGGGCLCLDPEGLLRSGQVYAADLDLHDGEPALPLEVEVVRRGISLGYPSAGLRFVGFAEKDREKIMRTLFREQRRRAVTGRV